VKTATNIFTLNTNWKSYSVYSTVITKCTKSAKIFCLPFYVFYVLFVKQKSIPTIEYIISVADFYSFTKKYSTYTSVVDPGCFITDPGSENFFIPDPES
jgi:hypothetical protein